MQGYGRILLAVILLAATLAAEVYTVAIFLKARQVGDWPVVPGVIVRSESTTQSFGTGVTYTAHIAYEYRVDGQLHQSDRVRTRGTSSKHKTDIDAVVKRYPVGLATPVHYNPAEPSEACLEAGVDFINYLIIVTPLIFAFAAGIYIVDAVRRGGGASRGQAGPEFGASRAADDA